MKKFLSILVCITMISALCTYSVSAETENEQTCYELFDVDTSAGEEIYKDQFYVYPKEFLDDGTTVIAGITDDPNEAELLTANADWNVSVFLYAQRLSSKYYKITAEAYTMQVLIYAFFPDIYFGDGSYSGSIYAVNQPPYVSGNCSFYSIGTVHHTYETTGTYTLSLRSCTIMVSSIADPDSPAYANPCGDMYTFVVS